MFDRFFRYNRPVECIQFNHKYNRILYEQIVWSNVVLIKIVLKYVQPSVRFQCIKLILTHADRIRLRAVHKVGSNWLTQEMCLEVGRNVNKFKRCLAKQTFLWNGL